MTKPNRNSGNWILHHDNAPAHTGLSPRMNFWRNTTTFRRFHILLTPLTLLRATSSCSPQLKKTMKGRRFDYVEEIEANATRQLRAITKSDYQRCFRQWQERWNKSIQAQGHYFEGDETN